MIGVDIVFLPRFLRAMSGEYRKKLIQKIFTPVELEDYYAKGLACTLHSLAGKYAVKEAVIKASGGEFGIGDLPFIEVKNVLNGSIEIVVRNKEGKDSRYEASSSHDGEYAIGIAIKIEVS